MMRKTIFYLSLLVLVIGISTEAMADVQTVTLTPDSGTITVGDNVTVTANYDVDNNDNTLTGIGIQFHYDSSKLTFTGFSNVFQTSKIGEESTPQNDTGDADGDASTDKYVSIAWASFSGDWPNQPLPLALAELGFTATTAGIGSTSVNASFTSKMSGYTASATNASITINPDVPDHMTLSASKTTLASDQKGTATLTGTLLDQYDNVVTNDNSTVIHFALTDATYLTMDPASGDVTVTAGVATATVTTKAGSVASPPATSGVNITSGAITPPATDPDVTLTIVNFEIDVAGDQTSLVQNPLTPNSVVLTGQGGTSGDYRWNLTGVGSFSSSSTVTTSQADSVTFYAPTTIIGDSQTATITLTDANGGSLTDQAVLTVYNPTQLVITSSALNQNAGTSGTMTVQVQSASGTPIAAGDFTVNLSTDSSGTAYFYTTGTTTGIASVTIADGQSSATFDYNDEKAGTPTVTVSATGLSSDTQQETILPAGADYMTLSASKTTLGSDQKGTATLTGTLFDQYDNIVTNDNSTVINFALTDATYLTMDPASGDATVSSGVATATVTTKAGSVASPPETSGVNITSGAITPPAADPDVTLTIVNFNIDVAGNQTDLVRNPLTSNSVVLTGQGGTSGDYRWNLTGVGSFSSSSTVTTSQADSVTFYAPTTITGDSQTATISLTDVNDGSLTDQVVLTVYNPTQLSITSSALNQNAGTSGTMTVQVQSASGTPITAGDFTVNLSTDSSGTAYFYTTGTTTGIASVTIADGQSSATFDYNDEKAGTPTVTVSATGLSSDTQQETILPAGADYMTLSASKTTLGSDQKGTATLTGTLYDQYNNVLTNDNSTVIHFAITDDTYLTMDPVSGDATVSSGVATATVTTKAGSVASPPETSGVNITSGAITPPAADPDVTLTIVNFNIDVAGNQTDLVRNPLTSNSVVLTGQGGTSGDYRWNLTGVGSFSSSSTVTTSQADSVTFYAPTTITGDSQTADISLTDVNDGSLTDQVTLTVYNPTQLSITSGALDQNAGTSGLQTVEVQVQSASGTPITAGAFTVNLSTDSSGTAHFYTTGTTTGIASVTIADGQSNAKFDYYDEKAGSPTITVSATGLTSDTQQQTISPLAADSMTLTANHPKLASNGEGTATLTATLYDVYGNVATGDSSTVVTFALLDDTYLTMNPASGEATASSGVATVTVTTKSGTVPSPAPTCGVNITAGAITPPAADPDLTLTIVNFALVVTNNQTNLLRRPFTPSSVQLNGIGGISGDYRWSISGVGSFSSSSTVASSQADSVTFFAPETISGDSQTTTVTLTDVNDPTGLIDSVTLTISNPSKLVITSTALSQTAGESGTLTVQVQSPTGNPVTLGQITVDLATDSTGNAYFYTKGTSSKIISVTIANGASSATFDYYDEKAGTPTVTASATSLTSDSQQETVTPGASKKITLEADKTTLVSDAKGNIILTITVVDQYDNVVTTNDSSMVNLSLTDSTYASLSSSSATVSAGVATVILSSKPGLVSGDSATCGVNITSSGLTPPQVNPDLTITIINFAIEVTGQTTLMTKGNTPDSVVLTGIGGTSGNYRWSINGKGSFSEYTTPTSSADSVTFYAPSQITGNSETATVTLTDANDTSITSTVVITIYKPLAVDNKPASSPIITAGASATYSVSGGDSTLYTWQVTDIDGNVIDEQTGASYTFTAPSTGDFAGVYTITVADNNGFSDSFQVKVPMNLTPDALAITELKYDGSTNPKIFTVNGANTSYTWEILNSADATSAVAIPGDYGTWTKSNPVTDGNSNTFNPADISEIKRFYIRITVNDDSDLTAENGLNQLVAGPYTVVPVATFTITLADSTGTAIDGSAITAGDITVTESVTDQTKDLTASNGQVDFILPDVSNTYKYTAKDNRETPEYINNKAQSKNKAVTITLESAGDDTISGTVQDKTGNPLVDATVLAYQPSSISDTYETTTDFQGLYEIVLPENAPQNGWTVVACLDGYVSISQSDQAIGTVDFTGATGLQAKTKIQSVTATAVDSTVRLDFTADPAFSASTEASVNVKTGSGSMGAITYDAGTIAVIYSANEDFSAIIKADTSEDHNPSVGYAASRVFTYEKEDTATAVDHGDIDAGGGQCDLTSTGGQPASVQVPAGGVNKDSVTIEMKQIPKDETDTNAQGSPLYVYEVTAFDSATGDALGSDDINRIMITLPIDLNVIQPGDLEAGIYVIYHADSRLSLGQSGGGTPVPVDQIDSTDYVGDGQVGSVTFWVTDLSVFAIGVSGSEPDDGTDDTDDTDDTDTPGSTSGGSGGSSGCFIDTTAGEIPLNGNMGTSFCPVILFGLTSFLFFVIKERQKKRR